MSFAKVQTVSRELNQVQSNIATALQPFFTNPLFSGAYINDKDLISGTNIIQTGLGRTISGYLITSKSGTATIYNLPFDGEKLTLIASAGVTINIYVF